MRELNFGGQSDVVEFFLIFHILELGCHLYIDLIAVFRGYLDKYWRFEVCESQSVDRCFNRIVAIQRGVAQCAFVEV